MLNQEGFIINHGEAVNLPRPHSVRPTIQNQAVNQVRPQPEHPLTHAMKAAKKYPKLCSSFSVVGAILVVLLAIGMSSHHTIKEGHVGIYFKYGALQESIALPGVHWKAPFVTSVEEVQVRSQTDTLDMMSAVTKDGITNTFQEVQVISRVRVDNLISMVRTFGLEFRNTLVFDRVKEELRIFCANHTIDEVYNTM